MICKAHAPGGACLANAWARPLLERGPSHLPRQQCHTRARVLPPRRSGELMRSSKTVQSFVVHGARLRWPRRPEAHHVADQLLHLGYGGAAGGAYALVRAARGPSRGRWRSCGTRAWAEPVLRRRDRPSTLQSAASDPGHRAYRARASRCRWFGPCNAALCATACLAAQRGCDRGTGGEMVWQGAGALSSATRCRSLVPQRVSTCSCESTTTARRSC